LKKKGGLGYGMGGGEAVAPCTSTSKDYSPMKPRVKIAGFLTHVGWPTRGEERGIVKKGNRWVKYWK
jgi:hypothetical protein